MALFGTTVSQFGFGDLDRAASKRGKRKPSNVCERKGERAQVQGTGGIWKDSAERSR